MAFFRQLLRQSSEKRRSHECALVDDHLHLFGGDDGSKCVPRNEISVMNVRRAEKKWIRRLARGRTIPPPCTGARCVVIDKMIYSYGGKACGGRLLEIVYRLDPRKMEWIEVATPIGEKKPHERSFCCLCAIGSRLIMFGGRSGKDIPRDQLQSGATQEGYWSNDIYEFEFEEGYEKGMWLDLELHGTRPKPLVLAAMATIDHHQALLHGRDLNLESHSFVMNMNNKTWTIIDFNVKPSPREGHRICQLVKQGLEDKSICLLMGGRMFNETNSDYVYVLDCEKSKSYQIDVDPRLGKVWQHTCHCVQNKEKTTEVFVCGGRDWDLKLKPIISYFHLDFEDESNMIMEQEILLSRRASLCAAISSPRLPLPSGSEEIDMMQRDLEHLRRRCVELDEEKRANSALFDEEIASIREELVSAQGLVQRKDGEIAQIRQQLASLKRAALVSQRRLEQRKDEQIASIRKELASAASTAQRRHREELEVSLTRCETLEASRDEIKKRLDEFTDVLNIKSDEVHLTDKKLGTGSFAGVSVGQWRGMTVAVKKIHDLITSQRNVAMFRREVLVCSRLHHPNIMIVCGAVMAEGAPLQIVMELLEGSVGEVIDAAHASGSYLTTYEQLSIAIDMTSGISYLHQIRPRPYVHGDIRPSNVLVARDMKVKVGDLGAAHLIESSLSAGPMSPPYLAPERTFHSGGSATISTLSSDVYSMGVSLIEIFTGVGPIPEERKTQLDALAFRPNLFMLCSRLIGCNPANRISAQRCFETLKMNFTERERPLSAQEIITAKRLVKGVFEGDTHKVVLLNISIN